MCWCRLTAKSDELREQAAREHAAHTLLLGQLRDAQTTIAQYKARAKLHRLQLKAKSEECRTATDKTAQWERLFRHLQMQQLQAHAHGGHQHQHSAQPQPQPSQPQSQPQPQPQSSLPAEPTPALVVSPPLLAAAPTAAAPATALTYGVAAGSGGSAHASLTSSTSNPFAQFRVPLADSRLSSVDAGQAHGVQPLPHAPTASRSSSSL